MCDFDWRDAESVIQVQLAVTAVYCIGRGELVIRQQHWRGDDSKNVVSTTGTLPGA